METEQQRRVVENEARLRAMNEQIRATEDQFRDEPQAELTIMCECGLESCESMLDLPAPTYQRIRQHGTWFVVCPEHLVPEVEHAVEEHAGFWIVEKDTPAALEAVGD